MKKAALTVTKDFTDDFNKLIKSFKNDNVVVGIPQSDKPRKDEEDDTINKILLNIKQKYCGFNPSLHNVLCIFIGEMPQELRNLKLDRDEQTLYDQEIFSIGFMDLPLTTVPTAGKGLARALKDALENPSSQYGTLLPSPVHAYLEAQSDYKQRLIQSLAD